MSRKPKESRLVDGIECWFCPRCHEWKPRNDYYCDARTLNGLKGQCKSCHLKGSMCTRDKINTRRLNREHMRRTRESNPEKFRSRDRVASRKRPKNTPAIIARRILNAAVRSGKIKTPSHCSGCGERYKLTAHHDDYSKPLKVEWICYECHGRKLWAT